MKRWLDRRQQQTKGLGKKVFSVFKFMVDESEVEDPLSGNAVLALCIIFIGADRKTTICSSLYFIEANDDE